MRRKLKIEQFVIKWCLYLGNKTEITQYEYWEMLADSIKLLKTIKG